jgi:hypothetical protein
MMDATKELEKIDRALWGCWLSEYVGGNVKTLLEFKEYMTKEQMYPTEAVDGFIRKYGPVRLLQVAYRAESTIQAIAKEQMK